MAPLAPFETSPAIAVAVSGGADSMTLLLLASQWASALGGSAVALSVDHGLRSESAQEVKQVAAWCNERGIEHHILTWSPPVLSSAIQARARAARYELLSNWCKAQHVLHLLTAHHRDDQAETLFFRLARGSGMDGLSCISPVSTISGMRILRPLLSVSKAQLIATLHQQKQSWIEDPSNQNFDYTRNHIRRQIASSPQADALSARAASLAQKFSAIRNLLEHKLASCLTNVVSLFPQGYAHIHHKEFLQLEPELAIRALSALTMTLSGESYSPRGPKLERLYDEMSSERISLRRTFGGLLFTRKLTKGVWLVCREANAAQGELSLFDSESALWDQRFIVSWAGDPMHMSVRPLHKDGINILTKLKYKPAGNLEKPVLAALPSFWNLEELVSVPHIGYTGDSYRHMEFSARFSPAKPLAANAFFSNE